MDMETRVQAWEYGQYVQIYKYTNIQPRGSEGGEREVWIGGEKKLDRARPLLTQPPTQT